MRSIMNLKRNKKAQVESIIAFVAIAVGLLILAPFLYRIVTEPLTKFSQAINGTDQNASAAVSFGVQKFVSLWDYVVMAAFFSLVIFMFVSAFLVDINPAFLIFYIIAGIVLFAFAPNFMKALDIIFSPTGNFQNAVAGMPATSFVEANFGIILLGIFVVSGILMYAKWKWGQGQQGGGYQ